MEEPRVPATSPPPYQSPEPTTMTSAPTTDLVVLVDEPAARTIDDPPRRSRSEGPRHLPPKPATNRLAVASSSVSLLALAIIAFLGQAGPLGWVEHARSQRVAYADLRRDLSEATVPTGQLIDKNEDGVGDALVPAGTPLGYLSSSELGLKREVLFEGTTSTVTEKGPGHLRSSVLPGQPGVSVLYGRAWGYGGPFRHVPDLKKGALLTFTTGQGQSTYRVTGTRHAGDRFVSPGAGQGVVTLVTAEGAPFVPSRVVYVDAELVSQPFPVAPLVLGPANLSRAESPLKGDPGLWSVLFLVMQGVALVSLTLAWAGRRFGTQQAWMIGVPVLGLLALLASREALRLLPNLL